MTETTKWPSWMPPTKKIERAVEEWYALASESAEEDPQSIELDPFRALISTAVKKALAEQEAGRAITRMELDNILADLKWSVEHKDQPGCQPDMELWHQLRMLLAKTAEPHDFFTAAELFKSAEWHVQRVLDLERQLAEQDDQHKLEMLEARINDLDCCGYCGCAGAKNRCECCQLLDALRAELAALEGGKP